MSPRFQSVPRLIVALAMALTVVAVLARGAMRMSGSERRVTIGVDVWVGFAPLYVAQELGYFEDEGLDVDLVVMKGTTEMRAALVGGRVDAVTTSIDTALRNRAAGTPARVALALDRSAGADGLVARAPIDTVPGLRGASVAVQPDTPSHFFLLYLLDRAGVPPTDVKLVEMDSADAGAAFSAGRVPAAVTWEPWLSQALEQDGTHLLASTKELPNVILDVLLVRDALLDERASDVERLRRAWFRAVDYVLQQPGEAAKLVATERYGVEPAVFIDMISGLEYLNAPRNRELIGDLEADAPMVRAVDAANRIFVGAGLLAAPVPPRELIHSIAIVRGSVPAEAP